jgi:ATP-dependent helicase HrpB
LAELVGMILHSASLPIDDVLAQIAAGLEGNPSLILVAEPGAGKTTRVPLALLDAPWLQGRKIVMLEPRRVAARAAARRMAESLGEEPGGVVGYSVRLDSKVSARTRIEVVTEGILTRRLQRDPSLADTGLVIFDEFHERSLDGDLGLALCREAQEALRPDLKLLVMSATLDVAGLSRVLGEAPLIEAAGRVFPVETLHLGRTSRRTVSDDVAAAIRVAMRAHEGSVLAFLPGEAEIKRTSEQVQGLGAMVAPLYGALSPAEQDAAIRPAPSGTRKIVLATTIAETSLTIEGVRIVIDSGLKRAPVFDPASGMTRLETVRVSQASATQRKGRAGRTGPGVCYRLWPEAETRALAAHDVPEILAADLTGLVLELAQWGVSDPASLSFLDQPPAAAFAQARDLLISLEALDDGGLTQMGRDMLALPLHPRLAHMVVRGKALGMGALACDIAAVLSERATGRDPHMASHLERLNGAARAASHQIRRISGVSGEARGSAGLLVALAYPDRIAQARGAPGQFRFSGGGGASLAETELLAREPFLAVASTDGNVTAAKIFLAAPISLNEIEEAFDTKAVQFVSWDQREEAVKARLQRRLGALILEDKALKEPDPEALATAMTEGARAMGLASLPWSDGAKNFLHRARFLARLMPELALPDLSDAGLLARLEAWLTPYLSGITRRAHLERLDMRAILEAMLPYEAVRKFGELAPARMAVPSGAEVSIDYETDGDPVLRVRLQEMFGLAATPRIAGGRQALRIELLSPAQRPLAVTQDLASFWVNAYPSVRSEMRGRYPKHSWPDNPLEAAPVKPRKLR